MNMDELPTPPTGLLASVKDLIEKMKESERTQTLVPCDPVVETVVDDSEQASDANLTDSPDVPVIVGTKRRRSVPIVTPASASLARQAREEATAREHEQGLVSFTIVAGGRQEGKRPSKRERSEGGVSAESSEGDEGGSNKSTLS